MSRKVVDLSVLPIDVGFDVRRHGMVVKVAAGVSSVAFDRDGLEVIVRGSALEIVAALCAAGYDANEVQS